MRAWIAVAAARGKGQQERGGGGGGGSSGGALDVTLFVAIGAPRGGLHCRWLSQALRLLMSMLRCQ